MQRVPQKQPASKAAEIDSVQLLSSFPQEVTQKPSGKQAVRVRIDFNRLHLRPASEGDYEFFYQLKKDAIGGYIRSTWGWDEDQQQDFHFREWHPESLDIITLDIKPIGSIRLRTFSDEMHLGQFYLRPTFQNLGIGSFFMNLVKEQAANAGLPLRIEVLKVNRAQEFYQRHGFRTIEGSKTHFGMEWRQEWTNAEVA